jgi:hypothetical protein
MVVSSIDEVESIRSKTLWVAAARSLTGTCCVRPWFAGWFRPSSMDVYDLSTGDSEGWKPRHQASERQGASELVPSGLLSQSMTQRVSGTTQVNAAPVGHGEAVAVKKPRHCWASVVARNACWLGKADRA